MFYIIIIVALSILQVLIYKLKKDIFYPMFIAISCFNIGCLFCLLNIYNWKYEIGSKTILTLLVLFFIMIICGFLSDYIYDKYIYELSNNKEYKIKILKFKINFSNRIKKILVIGIPVILFLMFFYVLNDRYSLCLENGYTGNIWDLNSLSMKWKSVFLTGSPLKHLSTYFRYLLKGFMLIALYNLIVNNDNYQVTDYIYWLFLIIPCVLEIYTSGLRSGYLFLGSAIIAFYGFRVHDKNENNRNLLSLIKYPILLLVVIIALMVFTAIIRKDSTDIRGLFNYLSVYFGGGIPLFDEFLEGIIGDKNSQYFGAFVFRNIYGILNRLKITNVQIRQIVLSCDTIINTNVYTAFYRSYLDFGLIGTCIYWGLISFVYTFAYNILKNNSCLIPLRALYGYYLTPLFVLATEDYFLQSVIGTEIFYMIISIYVAFYILKVCSKNSEIV